MSRAKKENSKTAPPMSAMEVAPDTQNDGCSAEEERNARQDHAVPRLWHPPLLRILGRSRQIDKEADAGAHEECAKEDPTEQPEFIHGAWLLPD